MKAVARRQFDQLALRAGFGTHAALFAHDVAFLVELAEDRAAKPLRLQQEPEFGAVRRKAVEIAGGIFAGTGVEADAPLLLDQPRKRIGFHEAVSLIDGALEFRFELLDLLRAGPGAAVALLLQLIVDLSLLSRAHRSPSSPVRGSDRTGAFADHVLEHMGHAAFARRIVHCARVHERVERDHRGLDGVRGPESASRSGGVKRVRRFSNSARSWAASEGRHTEQDHPPQCLSLHFYSVQGMAGPRMDAHKRE